MVSHRPPVPPSGNDNHYRNDCSGGSAPQRSAGHCYWGMEHHLIESPILDANGLSHAPGTHSSYCVSDSSVCSNCQKKKNQRHLRNKSSVQLCGFCVSVCLSVSPCGAILAFLFEGSVNQGRKNDNPSENHDTIPLNLWQISEPIKCMIIVISGGHWIPGYLPVVWGWNFANVNHRPLRIPANYQSHSGMCLNSLQFTNLHGSISVLDFRTRKINTAFFPNFRWNSPTSCDRFLLL